MITKAAYKVALTITMLGVVAFAVSLLMNSAEAVMLSAGTAIFGIALFLVSALVEEWRD